MAKAGYGRLNLLSKHLLLELHIQNGKHILLLKSVLVNHLLVLKLIPVGITGYLEAFFQCFLHILNPDKSEGKRVVDLS